MEKMYFLFHKINRPNRISFAVVVFDVRPAKTRRRIACYRSSGRRIDRGRSENRRPTGLSTVVYALTRAVPRNRRRKRHFPRLIVDNRHRSGVNTRTTNNNNVPKTETYARTQHEYICHTAGIACRRIRSWFSFVAAADCAQSAGITRVLSCMAPQTVCKRNRTRK